MDFGDEGRVLLRGRALENALTADAEALPGVAGAAVRLAGRRAAPRGRMSLLLEGDAHPDELLVSLDDRVLADARRSTGLEELPAEVRMHGERHRASRVE